MSQAAGRGLVDAGPGTPIVGILCSPFAAVQDPGPDDLDALGTEVTRIATRTRSRLGRQGCTRVSYKASNRSFPPPLQQIP
jgi:hypothetical protein